MTGVKIGDGEFADVYRGTLNRGGKHIDVAVKTLKVTSNVKNVCLNLFFTLGKIFMDHLKLSGENFYFVTFLEEFPGVL